MVVLASNSIHLTTTFFRIAWISIILLQQLQRELEFELELELEPQLNSNHQ
jgi:hypothetical protein